MGVNIRHAVGKRGMNRLVLVTAAITIGLSSICPDSAFADKRVALVIGNSAYQLAPTIPNPTRDAQAIAAEFTKAGFDIVSAHYDQRILQFKRAIRQFEDAAANADIAVVFYAGHGIEIGGVNYMIPVDAKLVYDRDAKDEAIELDRLLEAVDAAKRLGLVILDACRDNPFVRTMNRVSAVRKVNTGLALVEPTNRNVLVAYACKSGTAEDGDAEHSPYTAALLKNLFEPGLDLRLAFGRVRDDVLKSSRNRQEPFVYGSMSSTNIFSLVSARADPTLAKDLSGERRDYELVEKIGLKGAWNVFIAQHPTGFYADLARQQLAKLTEQGEAVRNRVEEGRPTKLVEEAAKRQRAEREAALRDALQAFIAIGGSGSDVDNARTLLGSLDRDRDIRALINRGRSYALIIGNKDYRDSNFSSLQTPHEDARSLANVLSTNYGFTTELILRNGSIKSLLLLDKPGKELLTLLDDLEESLTEDDRLLIFYAGHGQLDDRAGKAYWIPVEATKGRRSEFISADSIVSTLKGIKAHSVLVVADSCFSAALFRDASTGPDPSEAELANSLLKDVERSSRVLIASGGMEPVLDGGGSGHSIFTRKLLDALANPIRPIFSARELHVRRLKPSVSGTVKQVPQYDWLRESGHDAGDFIFVQVQATQAAASK
jgi:uncharacterized caspase-like protein